MNFKLAHNNFNVLDLDKSLDFYTKALNLKEIRRIQSQDGAFILAFLGDGSTVHQVELTWLRDRNEPYDLGDNEIHLCLTTDDYEAAYQFHKAMGCICYENTDMGIYFISDPDGYWIEIVPNSR